MLGHIRKSGTLEFLFLMGRGGNCIVLLVLRLTSYYFDNDNDKFI